MDLFSSLYRFHVYVGNRIGEILELSDSHQWQYIQTTQNPADDVSRGVLATEFSTDHRFYTGPPFLYESPENWPTFPDLKKEIDETEDVEICSTKWVGATIRVPDSIDKLIMKNSRYLFLLGVVDYVKRFINNARKSKQHRQFGKLSESEI